MQTKLKILRASIDRLNQQGLANVRMQHIAEDLGMSPGNLAYHFRTKESLIETIIDELLDGFREVLETYRVYPNLLDLDLQLNAYLKLMQRYPFYFMDIIEINRHFPELMVRRSKQIKKMMAQLEMRLEYNCSRGVLRPEAFAGQYADLADSIWMIMTFYPTRTYMDETAQQGITRVEFMTKIWNLVRPFLTQKGTEEYNALIQPLLVDNKLRNRRTN